MKKTLALIAVLSAGLTLASAAPVLSLHGAVGEGWGTSFENSYINGLEKPFGNNMDFQFGAGLNFTIKGYFGIQPEVNVAINTAGFQFPDTGHTETLNYLSLDIPVLVTYRINKWNFLVGPYVSFPLGKLKSTYSTDATSTNPTSESEIDITNTPFTVWGLTVGAGYEERIGVGRIVFGARYSLDFTPIKTNGLTVGGVELLSGNLFTRRALYIDISYKLALDF